MYHRNGSAPPPGYGGTAFDLRWPPREEPPREPRRATEQPVFAPFAAGKRPVEEPEADEAVQARSEPPPAQRREEQEPYPHEDTLLLLGILLLLLHGEDGADLLPLLSMLLL